MFVTLTNKTGAASVKGTIVQSHASIDDAVITASASSVSAIGVIYEDGVPDGSPVKVVVGGKAQVLLQNGTDAAGGNFCYVSSTPGRMDQGVLGVIISLLILAGGIGQSLQTFTGGTDKLCWVQLSFN